MARSNEKLAQSLSQLKELQRVSFERRTKLAKGTPEGREPEKNPGANRKVIAMPRVGGLRHRYDLTA
jgi:hypothetical protein